VGGENIESAAKNDGNQSTFVLIGKGKEGKRPPLADFGIGVWRAPLSAAREKEKGKNRLQDDPAGPEKIGRRRYVLERALHR